MSDPDPPPSPDPKSSEFRRSPSGPKLRESRREPRPEPDAGDHAPPQHSGFLAGCGGILMVLVGVLLLLPGACFMALYSFGGGMAETGATIITLGVAAIAGGIAVFRGRHRPRP